MAELRESVVAPVGPGLAATVDQLLAEALRQSEVVWAFGLSLAGYTGLAWMYRVREALSAPSCQRTAGPPYLTGAVSVTVALLGLGLVLAASLGLVVLCDALAGVIVGPEGVGWVRGAGAAMMTVGSSLAANLLVPLGDRPPAAGTAATAIHGLPRAARRGRLRSGRTGRSRRPSAGSPVHRPD